MSSSFCNFAHMSCYLYYSNVCTWRAISNCFVARISFFADIIHLNGPLDVSTLTLLLSQSQHALGTDIVCYALTKISLIWPVREYDNPWYEFDCLCKKRKSTAKDYQLSTSQRWLDAAL